MSVIDLEMVSKAFVGTPALTDIDLHIEPGEIHAVVGENGAGKSTFAKILMGVHQHDSGSLRIRGHERRYISPHDALADGIAGIAQEVSLVSQRSVIENVFLGREPRRHGFVRTGALRQSLAALEERTRFGLPSDAVVGSLALADQQKVEILRALARDAQVLVMDEPTAAISRHESEALFDVIRQLRDDGTAVVYISHDLDEVLELADRITVLRDGRLVRSSPAQGETPEALVESMLGRPLATVFPTKASTRADADVRLSVRALSRAGAYTDVSFSVRRGEILGLAGLVGSGRTEIARAIIGADRADRGVIAVDGREVKIRSPRDAIDHGIAYLTESRKDDGLLLGRSITENVTLPHLRHIARRGLLFGSAERDCARKQLEGLNVTATSRHAPVRRLSGGNQQKVLFARWLVFPPKVFILDEPTRGVDIGAKAAIYNLIRHLADQGTAIVMISAEHEELIGMANRVVVVRRGRLVKQLEGDGILENAIVSAALTD